MKPTLSIIIPIYNIDRYLSECLNSIVNQGNDSIEVILVNDGSIDESGSIAAIYVTKYNYVHIINQKNQGVSVARNNGLKKSKGEYVWFIDGDDWIQGNLNFLLKEIKTYKQDFFLIDVIKSTANLRNPSFDIYTQDQNIISCLPSLVKKNIIHCYPVNKIVRRDILEQGVFFPESIVISEDFYWNCQLFQKATTFMTTDCISYIYRLNRADSATHRLNEDKIKSIIKVLTRVHQEITEITEINNSVLKRNLIIYTTPVWFFVLPELMQSSKKNREEGLQNLLNIYQQYILYDIDLIKYNRGAKLLSLCQSFFGINIGVRIYCFFINLKRKLSRYR